MTMENLEEIKRIQAAGMDVAAVERMKFMMLRHTVAGGGCGDGPAVFQSCGLQGYERIIVWDYLL